jgi:hypothetical protein
LNSYNRGHSARCLRSQNIESTFGTPGTKKLGKKSKALEAGADLLQSKSPLKKQCVPGQLPFYNGNINAKWKHIMLHN